MDQIPMRASWTRWQQLRRLTRETRALRQTLVGVQAALERIAAAVELANLAAGVTPAVPVDAQAPLVDVTFVDSGVQAEFADIELRLTQATGQPPTEDEIMAEYERRHPAHPQSYGHA